jgi:hypothetical protein
MTTLYKKVQSGARVRYEPVAECDSLSAMPAGAHLVIVSPGMRSARYGIDPAYADVLAAMETYRPEILRAVMPAFEPKPAKPLTSSQRYAFEQYKKATGHETLMMMLPSANCLFDAMAAAIKARV